MKTNHIAALVAASMAAALAGCASTSTVSTTASTPTSQPVSSNAAVGKAPIGTIIAAINGFAVTQGQLDTAQSLYDGTSLAALRRYALLPRCASGAKFTISAPCHDPSTLKKWSAADLIVASDFAKVQALITSGDNTGAAAAWSLLQTALSNVSQIAASSGANQLSL